MKPIEHIVHGEVTDMTESPLHITKLKMLDVLDDLHNEKVLWKLSRPIIRYTLGIEHQFIASMFMGDPKTIDMFNSGITYLFAVDEIGKLIFPDILNGPFRTHTPNHMKALQNFMCEYGYHGSIFDGSNISCVYPAKRKNDY